METKYLFAYGTLQFPYFQKEVLGRELVRSTFAEIIDGWKIKQVIIEDVFYFTLIQDEKSFIGGTIFEITENDLPKLDEFETNKYKRIEVITESGVRCYMYVDNDKNKKDLFADEPFEEFLRA